MTSRIFLRFFTSSPNIRMSDLPTSFGPKPTASASARPPPPPATFAHSSYPQIIDLFTSLLPPAPHHLPILYHTPRRSNAPINKLILSVTPTPGVYAGLTPRTAVFLHRPWALERRRLFVGNLVLTSHQRLDEVLTTGYNLALMDSLGLGSGSGANEGAEGGSTRGRGEIVGYKGDPERKMGVVFPVPESLSRRTVAEWREALAKEFGGLEGDNFEDLLGPDSSNPASTSTSTTSEEGKDQLAKAVTTADLPRPKYIACMNAFEPTIIDRLRYILSNASPDPENPHDSPLLSLPNSTSDSTPVDPSSILYITGEPRPLGLETAKSLRMPTLFVGHNRSEVWAIKWLARQARQKLGDGVEVVVVDEEEVVPPKPEKPVKAPRPRKDGARGGQTSRKRKSEEKQAQETKPKGSERDEMPSSCS
jgi:hypothetical protein